MRIVRAERHARAMGSTVHVIVAAHGRHADDLADLALLRIGLLEDCWTRFRPDSELSRLNARAGTGPVTVSEDLAVLVAAMLAAAAWTDGAFDPTVLHAVDANGYDADFAAVVARDAVAVAERDAVPAPGTHGIALHRDGPTVSLPAGIGLDPGAIGKGLAADIVASEIHAAGAHGALVNLGGDVSARGDSGRADETGWTVTIRDDRLDGTPAVSTITITLAGDRRAVSTSSSLKRRWHGRHHVIDPSTGQPSVSDLAQATVVAPTGWQAEAASTLALVRGTAYARDWLASAGVDAALFPHDPAEQPRLTWEAAHAR